jgi:hypothetical protein
VLNLELCKSLVVVVAVGAVEFVTTFLPLDVSDSVRIRRVVSWLAIGALYAAKAAGRNCIVKASLLATAAPAGGSDQHLRDLRILLCCATFTQLVYLSGDSKQPGVFGPFSPV